MTAAGINPLPIQRPIPIWIGGSAEPALKRAAEMADGFFPQRPLEGGWPETLAKMKAGARRPAWTGTATASRPGSTPAPAPLTSGAQTYEEWKNAGRHAHHGQHDERRLAGPGGSTSSASARSRKRSADRRSSASRRSSLTDSDACVRHHDVRAVSQGFGVERQDGLEERAIFVGMSSSRSRKRMTPVCLSCCR